MILLETIRLFCVVMEVVCKDAIDELCISLKIVSCCDYYEDGFVFIRNSNNRVVKRFDDERSLINHLENENENQNETNDLYVYGGNKNIVMFLHDLTIQINYLHKKGYTFTDVDENDIIFIDGHYGIINSYKLIKFDKSTGLGSLNYPITFGNYKAPELSNITTIPAFNSIHKNSIIWSIGRIIYDVLFDNEYINLLIKEIDNNETFINCSGFNIFNVVKRCLFTDPVKRILLIV